MWIALELCKFRLPGVDAVVVARMENPSFRNTTNEGWPRFTRVIAIMNWPSFSVRTSLGRFRVPSCSLYDQRRVSVWTAVDLIPTFYHTVTALVSGSAYYGAFCNPTSVRVLADDRMTLGVRHLLAASSTPPSDLLSLLPHRDARRLCRLIRPA
ncbi:hypothetical protein LXA43DRAFT_1060652 [Ganoderma leucocontextum]|nr:hypothetical protein LXA43DRAFT_1060652 [Ganoderma leucocontextum]